MPTNDNIRIRPASPADVPAIVLLVNAAYSIETFLDGTRTDKSEIRKLMQKGNFLLAEDPAKRTVASVYTEVTGQRGYFGMLAVHPAQQGKGLGRFMVGAAEEHCRRAWLHIDGNHNPQPANGIAVLLSQVWLRQITNGTVSYFTTTARRLGVSLHCYGKAAIIGENYAKNLEMDFNSGRDFHPDSIHQAIAHQSACGACARDYSGANGDATSIFDTPALLLRLPLQPNGLAMVQQRGSGILARCRRRERRPPAHELLRVGILQIGKKKRLGGQNM
jgi:GNAT superfamily N-acetyltransferase